ncbi:MAG TPA: FGGY family carbohydrate kinase [Roseiarcus sp.]|nr:FGGY family carbohydrate kinase [Roseiarcus sp.]
MSDALVLAIDNGTSSTKCLLVDDRGQVVGRGQAPVSLATPEPGWVEQDANEIWASVRTAVSEALDASAAKRVVSVGLSTQRESCVIWDRRSGKALTPVLSWQDQRTESVCQALRDAGHGAVIRRKSGLPLDPMFSAAKARWLLDRLPSGQARAAAAEICIGTIDAFILSRFGGEAVIEAGNASRTQLFDVVEGRWDEELLSIFDVPLAAMPRVVGSTGPFSAAKGLEPLPDGVPVGAVMADSHSALFAHGAYAPGPVKATHGTGSSVMGLVDRKAVRDGDAGAAGVCLTLAWQVDAPMLAFEGNIRSAGSTLIWAAELLGVDTQELARLAAMAADSRGVHVVPAFGGLGAPWWDASAVGIVSGVTFGVTRIPLARAALDSIAHQIADVLDAVWASGAPVERLLVDGGPTRNNQLMQFEADMVGVPVERTDVAELSAMGVAHLAGVGAGLFTLDRLGLFDRGRQQFIPNIGSTARASQRNAWRRAVARSRGQAIL